MAAVDREVRTRSALKEVNREPDKEVWTGVNRRTAAVDREVRTRSALKGVNREPDKEVWTRSKGGGRG